MPRTDHLNGDGRSGPTPAWYFDGDSADLEQELAVRATRIAGLDRRAAEEEDES